MNNKQTHVLMSGWARSGANLTGSIINAHSNASFSVDVLKYMNFCFKRYPEIDDSNIITMLNEMHLRLRARFSIDFNIDYCITSAHGNFSHENMYKVLTSHIVDHDKNSPIIGESEVVAWGGISYFLDHIKNSKAIMILRDPRDVLVSFKKNTIATGNDYLISVFNSLSSMKSWLDYEKAYPERFHGVRFEDLKFNPESIAHGITNFLDIEFESSMLESQNWKKLRGGDWKEWENHNSSSFRDNDKLKVIPVGRWRSLIDPVDHFICEWIAGDAMELFNIEREFQNPSVEILKAAVERLMSSPLLREAFLNYIYSNEGSEKYPLDPTNPTNWDKRFIDNKGLLGLE